MQTQVLLGPSFELSPTGLRVIGTPTIDEYDEAFRRLSLIESASSWWWGDLALAREHHYGSLQTAANKYNKDYKALSTCQWVASRYEPPNRLGTLGFKHHMIAAPLENRLEWLKRAQENKWSASELAKQIRLSKLLPPNWDSTPPIITPADYRTWLPQQPDCDLLITDPPYSTEIKDIRSFAKDWLPLALAKVKPTGRAYIFIGAYPEEIRTYLAVKVSNVILANVLVWEYQNTIGPTSKLDYNLNWQAILYYRGPDAPELDCPILTEQFAVQEVNAPDGRTGLRYSEWQKPDELAERLIRHSTKPGHLVLDCFAGTGTFLLAAAKFKRIARGCDISQKMVDIAATRGCQVVKL
ncbi:MAG: site-specific DNA-methyltransferase [Deltaproteobacteria bacterium]|nr:site-specific DNA-methyltransferase [Deltaproteobacteria bacterium]